MQPYEPKSPDPHWIDPPANLAVPCSEAEDYVEADDLEYTNEDLIGPWPWNGDDKYLIKGKVSPKTVQQWSGCGGTILHTWTMPKYCLDHKQNITVTPAADPEWIDPPEDKNMSCADALNYVPNPKTLRWSNNAEGKCKISGSSLGVIVVDYGQCGGTITQTWEAVYCGKKMTLIQTITVQQAPPAQWINPPSNRNMTPEEADQYIIWPIELKYDNKVRGRCQIAGTALGVIVANYTECGGVVTQTWTAPGCNNQPVQRTQTITVTPATQAQWLQTPSILLAMPCQEADLYAQQPYALEFSNNLTGTSKIAGAVLGMMTVNIETCGNVLQNWLFVDACGRVLQFQQTVVTFPKPEVQFFNVPPAKTIDCNYAQKEAQPKKLMYSNQSRGRCLEFGEETSQVIPAYTACQGGTITHIWQHFDQCGRMCQELQTITVRPTDPITWGAIPPNITVSCEEALNLPPVGVAYRNKGVGQCLNVGVAFSVDVGAFTADLGGALIRNWDAVDACGTVLHVERGVTVKPAPEAEWVDEPANLIVDCADAVAYAVPLALTYDNHKNGACRIHGTENSVAEINYTPCNGGTILRKWEFTDAGDRTIKYEQKISVRKMPVAHWVDPPAAITLSCEDAIPYITNLEPLNYTNDVAVNCAITGSVTCAIEADVATCGGTIKRKWEYTDTCARKITHKQIIYVTEAAMPVFDAPPPATIILSPAALAAYCANPIALTYSNGSLGIAEIKGVVVGVILCSTCGGAGATQTWETTDPCGRRLYFQQQVLVDATL